MSEKITEAGLRKLAGEWLGRGRLVAGPVEVKRGLVLYRPLASAEKLLLSGFLRPANSIKEFVFPRHEKLYSYRLEGNRVMLGDVEPLTAEQLVLGARPCDAAALPVLDPIFNWDYKDEFYNARRAATVVVTIACKEHDDSCFCTSVGLGPAAERGSDAMLFDLGGGEFEVRTLTPAGRALFAGRTHACEEQAPEFAGPPLRFEAGGVRRFLESRWDDPVWSDEPLRCLACGACAYTCPTCHCFDIVDEGNAAGGMRVKNWDSCQFPLFTHHASGHNPRPVQQTRQRQRILHKFRIYPEKFGEILCTGCGNCTRNCPVGLGVLGVLEAIEVENEQHLQA